MKKALLIFSSVFIGFAGYAQTQLWGMTQWGGQYNSGIIFKTDGLGNNQTVQQNFFRGDYGNSYDNLLEASNGNFYGMTIDGGANGYGVIFIFNPVDSSHTKILDFDGVANGRSPYGSLMQASDGFLYGMTKRGGINDQGVLFRFDPINSIYAKLIDFSGAANGASPMGTLMQATDGMLYGVTPVGGNTNDGVLFQFDPVTLTFTKKIDFFGAIYGNACIPKGNLIQANDGMLYGTTAGGGINGYGTLYQFDLNSSVFTKLFDFDLTAFGGSPNDALLQALDGKLYGVTPIGGINNFGVLFSFDLSTSIFTKIIEFAGNSNGKNPTSSLVQATDGMLYGMTRQGGINNMGIIFQFDPISSVCTKKLDFNGVNNGSNPNGGLIEASDGKLYGLTYDGGIMNFGVLFQFDPVFSTYSKKLTFLEVPNGKFPGASLMQASDGKLYGLNTAGGANNKGVLFQFDPITSTITNKYEFDGPANGSQPYGSLIQASDGMLYGMTNTDGANNMGVLFQYDLATSTYTKKLDFDGATNGEYPMGSLLQATDGKLYGMTFYGGVNGLGVLFQFDPVTSTYIKLLDFDGITKGSYPLGSLVQASNGVIYGMTGSGGANNMGVLFQYDPSFSTYTNLLDFSGFANGSNPSGSLIHASDGMLFGLTVSGGTNNFGVLFQFDPTTLVYTKRFDFDTATIGRTPQGSLLQASDGKFYGMTTYGGIYNYGVIFQFDPITSMCTKTFDFNRTNGESPLYGSLIEISTTFSIVTSSTSTTICDGSSIIIPFSISGIFYNGNNFTAQLSDATGSFASPMIIGTLASTNAGSINAIIPSSTLAGTGYRIRVVSSNPVIIGSDNGSNITINPSPTVLSGTIIISGCSMSTGSVDASFTGGTPPYTYAWFPGNIPALTNNNVPAGSYTFIVTDSNNCIDSTIMTMLDSCAFVWPGDANEDAVADNNDILAIGIANSATGTTRANATLNWIGQPSANWNQTLLSGTDYKYVDCDGDGIIQPADTIAVIQNFGFTHVMRQGPPPMYDASLPDLKIIMGLDTIPSNSIGTLAVSLGSTATQISNLYGIAFTINFDPTQIDASTFRMNENGTWMGIPGNNLMGVVMNSGTGTGSVQIAITRLDHLNTNGFGNIANLSFMTTNALTGTGLSQNVVFSISNVTAISASEIGQTVNAVNDSVVVVDSALFIGIVANQILQNISIYPSPSSGIFTLTSTYSNEEISICNLLGENVFSSTINNPTSTINLSDKPNGIYFITVKTENNYFTQKIVIQK